MQYITEIEIALPREQVIELFDDVDNLYKWQRGLKSFKHLSGEAGQPGAKSELVFQMGKRTVEMIETIIVRDLPDTFSATFDAKGVHNVVENSFEDVDGERTRWVSRNEFQFKGFMKVIGFLMKGAFPKESLKHMQNFKAFAEEGKNVNE